MSKKLTTEEFIEKSQEFHGKKYDYSISSYKGQKYKVTIICKIHGNFMQFPRDHWNGCGCQKCSINIRAEKRADTNEGFIRKAQKIHKNKYDYSLVDYINSILKIKIICPTHGEFMQKPNGHLNGKGCKMCCKTKKLTTQEFIEKANKIHNNKYDYELVKYTTTHNEVIIICKNHGKFNQTPHTHFEGSGCPKCNDSKGETKINQILLNKSINFTRQKKFNNCKYKCQLPFDFYLPEQNICIEYDGEQHFKAIEVFGGKKSFKERQVNDKIKTEYCKKNNIKLLRIPYTELKNIENIMSNYLN